MHLLLFLRAIYLNNPTVMSLFKIHNQVSKDNPETVLWGVSGGNYFLSTELHCSKSTAATEDEKPMLVKTWRIKGLWGTAYHTLSGFFISYIKMNICMNSLEKCFYQWNCQQNKVFDNKKTVENHSSLYRNYLVDIKRKNIDSKII